MRVNKWLTVLTISLLAMSVAGVVLAGAPVRAGASASLAAAPLPEVRATASERETGAPTAPLPSPTLTPTAEAPLCTFTAARAINLRAGAGTDYLIVGVLQGGESIDVTGQATGADGFIWWQAGAAWVRSDLGESDCAPVCGNRVCEAGEDHTSCPQDCPAPTTPVTTDAVASTPTPAGPAAFCVASDCEACYRTISCYPSCSVCTCSTDAFGCPTCYCTYPSDQTQTTGTTPTTRTCEFASCAACIAAFPCTGGPCGTTTCELNEFGCPVCTTAP